MQRKEENEEDKSLMTEVPSDTTLIFDELYRRVQNNLSVQSKRPNNAGPRSTSTYGSPFPIVLTSTIYGSYPSTLRYRIDQDLTGDRSAGRLRMLRLTTDANDFVLARASDIQEYVFRMITSINSNVTTVPSKHERSKVEEAAFSFYLFLSNRYKTMESITGTDLTNTWRQWIEEEEPLEASFAEESNTTTSKAVPISSQKVNARASPVQAGGVSDILKILINHGLLVNRMDIRSASDNVRAYWFGAPQSSGFAKSIIESRIQLKRILSGRMFKEYDKVEFLKKYPSIKGVDSHLVILDAMGIDLIQVKQLLGRTILCLK